MVKDFGIADNEEKVGYYSGYLASSFFFGQFVSSYFWGYLSDKYGRRPILLIGVFGSMVSTTLFGFSPTYFWAIFIRTCGGLMNSNFSTARSYIGDITDPTNRVRGFSFIGLMWGAGSVFGPVTGGLLANPGENISLSPDSILHKYPYMLPSLVSGILSLGSWFVALLLLKESNREVLRRKGLLPESETDNEMKDLSVSSSEDSLLADSNQESDSSVSDVNEKQQELYINKSSVAPRPSLWDTIRSKMGSIFKNKDKKYSHIVDDEEFESDGADSITQAPSQVKIQVEQKQIKDATQVGMVGVFMVLKDRNVMITIILLALISLAVVTCDELFPLWAMNPPPIGLGFKSAKIGMSWIIGGVTLVVFQGLIYPRLTEKVGLLTMIRYGAIGFAIDFICFPLLAKLNGTGAFLWIGLGAVLCGRYIGGSSVGTTLNILVNSVGGDTVRKNRGAVNGIAMSVSGILRALAPVFGSTLFAWSNTSGLSFPFNHYFVFVIMAMVLVIIFFISLLIPKNAVFK